MRVLLRIAAFLAGAGIAFAAAGQAYPSKSLRIVVAFPAGGPIDIVARHIAPRLSEVMGQQVVIDNRAGANGIIGTEHVAKSAPDGHTMNLGTVSALIINLHLYSKLPYATLSDLAGVTLVITTPELLVVHPSVPAKSVKELIAMAKARPGQVVMASTGSGGLPHLALELLKSAAKADMLHVPYKGAAPAVADLLGGQVYGMFADLPVLHPHVVSGKLRALAVAAPKRSPVMPALPTIGEQGYPSVLAVNWYGVLVPVKTPRDIVNKLHDGFVKAMGKPELRERLTAIGAEPATSTPEQFTAMLREEFARWGKIVKESGAKID